MERLKKFVPAQRGNVPAQRGNHGFSSDSVSTITRTEGHTSKKHPTDYPHRGALYRLPRGYGEMGMFPDSEIDDQIQETGGRYGPENAGGPKKTTTNPNSKSYD